MNLLNVANEINAELAAIRAKNDCILSDQGRVDIFNSIMMSLTEGLLDIIKLSIIHKNREFLSWGYDLRHEKSIQRSGPGILEIIAKISRLSEGTSLSCQVQWSRTFQEMDFHSRERILRNTIWDEHRDQVNSQTEDSRDPQALSLQGRIELERLEFDLRNLESYTGLISPRVISLIIESARQSFSKGYIEGVQMIISNPDEEHPAIEWAFEFRSGSNIIRQGPPIEKILLTARQPGGHSKFEIKPILSPMFETLSPEDRESAMKGTIWEAHFKAPREGGWWSR